MRESLSGRVVTVVLVLALAVPVPVRANDKAGCPTVVHGGISINRDGKQFHRRHRFQPDHQLGLLRRTGEQHDPLRPAGARRRHPEPGTGSQPTHINGTLSSNGAVYVTNPSGVVVGANGVVRTDGGFVASTLHIDDADFLGGGPNGTAAMRFSHA